MWSSTVKGNHRKTLHDLLLSLVLGKKIQTSLITVDCTLARFGRVLHMGTTSAHCVSVPARTTNASHICSQGCTGSGVRVDFRIAKSVVLYAASRY